MFDIAGYLINNIGRITCKTCKFSTHSHSHHCWNKNENNYFIVNAPEIVCIIAKSLWDAYCEGYTEYCKRL